MNELIKNKPLIKQLIYFFLMLTVLVIVPDTVHSTTLAEEVTIQSGSFTGSSGADLGQAEDPRFIAAQIIKNILGFVGILFVAYTIYAGYLILTSAGEEEKVRKGKRTLLTAVIGVLIALSTYAITAFVTKNLLDATKSKAKKFDEAGVLEGYLEIESREFNPCLEGRGDPVVCGR